MIEQPSLADEFLEGTYKFVKDSVPGRWRGDADRTMSKYRAALRRAIRFEVQSDLVALITEISMRTTPAALAKRMGSAIVPYETTWIEFDLHQKVATSARLAGVPCKLDDVPERAGLLLERDAQVPTRWSMNFISNMKGSVTEGNTMVHPVVWVFDSVGSVDKMIGYPTIVATDKNVPDWARGAGWGYSSNQSSDLKDIVIPDIITGHAAMSVSHLHQMLLLLMPKTMPTEHAKRELSKDYVTDMREHVGMLRWAVTLLAVLSEVPTVAGPPVAMPGSRQVGSLRRNYMDYHRLTVKLPKKRPVTYLERKLDHAEAARRRAHEVRSHWRTYIHQQARCEHDWVYGEGGRRECSKCRAIGVLIPEHVRGDPALGWVRKDYVLERA